MDAIFGALPSPNFGKPYGVFARNDRLYVSDTFGDISATIFDLKKRTVRKIGSTGRIQLAFPSGIAADSDEQIYVADAKFRTVFVYSQEGKLLKQIGKPEHLESPAGIAVHRELKRLYVVDTRGHKIVVYSLRGERLFQFGIRGTGDGEFNFPTNLAIGTNGKLYVTDTNNFRVQVFDAEGKYLSQFGSIGDTPGFFGRPKGISIDTEGNIYVVDSAFHVVQIFNEKHQLLLYFGGPGQGPGQMMTPSSIFIDEDDRIYVVDQINGRVQCFQYLSEQWKKSHAEELREFEQVADAIAKNNGYFPEEQSVE